MIIIISSSSSSNSGISSSSNSGSSSSNSSSNCCSKTAGCFTTYPAQTANKRPQIAQQCPYIWSSAFSIFISITLYCHNVSKDIKLLMCMSVYVHTFSKLEYTWNVMAHRNAGMGSEGETGECSG